MWQLHAVAPTPSNCGKDGAERTADRGEPTSGLVA